MEEEKKKKKKNTNRRRRKPRFFVATNPKDEAQEKRNRMLIANINIISVL